MEKKPTPAPAPLAPSEELVRVNAQVTQAEHLKIKMHAVKNQTTISELIRAFIKTIPD